MKNHVHLTVEFGNDNDGWSTTTRVTISTADNCRVHLTKGGELIQFSAENWRIIGDLVGLLLKSDFTTDEND